MLIETVVLRGHEGQGHVIGQVGQPDPVAIARPAGGDQLSVAVEKLDPRGPVERIELLPRRELRDVLQEALLQIDAAADDRRNQ